MEPHELYEAIEREIERDPFLGLEVRHHIDLIGGSQFFDRLLQQDTLPREEQDKVPDTIVLLYRLLNESLKRDLSDTMIHLLAQLTTHIAGNAEKLLTKLNITEEGIVKTAENIRKNVRRFLVLQKYDVS